MSITIHQIAPEKLEQLIRLMRELDIEFESTNIITDGPLISEPEPGGSIFDFVGIWEDNPVTLEEIRAKAWR